MSKCPSCDEEQEDFQETRSGGQVCQACYENGIEYASTITCFQNGELQSTRFDNDFNYGFEDGPDPFEVVQEQKWVNTDGWRGYTDWVLKPEYQEFAGGWVTGYPDETVKHKVVIHELFEDLKEGKECPVNLFWLFGNTSNVFSQVTSLVVLKSDLPAFEAWLESNYGVQKIKEGLS
jgi:hypothetical protein